VARDRQRSKQRRQRQGGPSGSVRAGARRAEPAPGDADDVRATPDVGEVGETSADAREGDDLDETSADAREGDDLGGAPADVRDLEEPGATGATPAPHPLKHASSEVDQARLAEAGAVHPDVEYDLGSERAPDAVQGDIFEDERDPAVTRAEVRQRGRLLTFLRHCAEELRRVKWPDRRQVGQATAVVLGFVVLAGGYLGLIDAIMQPLVNALL